MRCAVSAPRSLPGAPDPDATIDFEGTALTVSSKDPVGVALLRHGEWVLSRSVKYHRPRGLFCLDHDCAGCLMRLGGDPNQFACTSLCREGLAVSRQNAFPSAGRDVWRAIDWAYPGGLNHHEMFAGVPVAETVMAKVARQLAGYGELPESSRAIAPASVQRTEVCLIGLGRSGSAALERLTGHGIQTLGIERTAEAHDEPREAVGIYRDGSGLIVVVRRESGLILVRPQALLVCTGSRDQTLSFPGNDRPGVFTGRALTRLIRRHRLLPSPRILIAGDGPSATEAAEAAREAGAEVRILEPGFALIRARGGRRLSGVDLRRPDGTIELWAGEAMAACGPRSPLFELGAEAGAGTVAQAGGFALSVDAGGETRMPDVFAAGSCTDGAGDSAQQGIRVAQALVSRMAA
jgi:sarcosine oxidase subunit alpha